MKKKYLTEEKFSQFLQNDFAHVRRAVNQNKKWIWLILVAVVLGSQWEHTEVFNLIVRLLGG